MKLLKSLLVIMILFSCGNTKTRDKKTEEKNPIKVFVSKLPIVSGAFSYDLLEQDDDQYYKAEKSDSLFCQPFVPIIGLLPDTTDNYKILYLESGDDLYPALKVFSKNGQLTDEQTISYTDCAGWDCPMDSCRSFIRVVNKGTVERSIRIVTTECDSTGAKVPNTTITKIKNQLVSVNPTGKIVFGAENLR